MKHVKIGMALTLMSMMVLFGCRPDTVGPADGGAPSLHGAVDDPHPALDSTCTTTDTLFLVREDNGSPVIDKCFGMGGIPITCPPGQLEWGYLVMKEGYFAGVNYIDCDFSMAPGWYCDFNNWQFGTASAFIFDSNGLPIVSNDWGVQVVNPALNKWQLRIRVDSVTTPTTPCFDLALRVHALKLNLFGAPINGSQTNTWGRNRNWNVSGHPEASTSQWLLHFCPTSCLSGAVLDTTEICKTVYTAAGTNSTTCSGNGLNCITLNPPVGNPGTIEFLWSTGATTQDITVCPTATTDYFVRVTISGTPAIVYKFHVNVVDASCTAESPIVQLDFCTTNLNVRYNQTFNIRDYVRFYNGGTITGNQWNQVRFTYTEVGANNPTTPADWNLAAFNAGLPVTVTAADYAVGTGNVARGQYRLYAYRVGRTTYDDYITIRVNNGQVSTVNSAMCVNIVGGPVCLDPPSSNGGVPMPGIQICHTPPGNTGAATTLCVPTSMINNYVAATCTGIGTGQLGYTIGACGSDPCATVIVPRSGGREGEATLSTGSR